MILLPTLHCSGIIRASRVHAIFFMIYFSMHGCICLYVFLVVSYLFTAEAIFLALACMYVHHELKCPRRPEGNSRFLEPGVTVGDSHMGAGN